ncbi:MAG: DnaJ C-terminal domain-containing protein [Planctomycetota bacterium]
MRRFVRPTRFCPHNPLMEEDYYAILKVSRDASADEIQKSYRKLAAKYHPDMNEGNKKARETFQKVQRAYEVLNDPEKRKLYDKYGSSFEGASGGGPGGPQWRSAGPGGVDIDFSQFFGGGGGGGGGGDPFSEIFKQFGGAGGAGAAGGGRRAGRRNHRGSDITHTIDIPFKDSIIGGEVSLKLERPGGQGETITVRIPPGVADGQTIRVRGQGDPGGGVPGDLLLTVRVGSHPFFTRRDNDLIVRVPVSLGEAVGGAKVDVPTPWGEIAMKIPAGTSGGKRLRIKGHGVRSRKGEGDLFVEVQIVLPATLNDEQRRLAEKFDAIHPVTPRVDLQW